MRPALSSIYLQSVYKMKKLLERGFRMTIEKAKSHSEKRNLARINKLASLYDIKGDGVAQARIESLTASANFQASVKKLSDANLDREDRS